MSSCADDVETTVVPSELLIFRTMFESLEPVHFSDIEENLSISPQERVTIDNVIIIIKLVLTTGATSATLKRSFSLVRRVKTWLSYALITKRFNALGILHSHKDIVDKLSLVPIGNDFVDNLLNWQNNFGTFSGPDLH